MKFIKWFIAFLLTILFILIIFFIYIVNRFNPRTAVLFISTQLLNKYSLDLSLKKASIDFRKGIKLEDVELIDTLPKKKVILVKAKEINIRYNPLEFNNRVIDINQISASGINLSYTELTNIVSLLRSRIYIKKKIIIPKIKVKTINIDDSLITINNIPVNYSLKYIFSDSPLTSPLKIELKSRFGSLAYLGNFNKGSIQIRDLNIKIFSPEVPEFIVINLNGEFFVIERGVFNIKGINFVINYNNYLLESKSKVEGILDYKLKSISLKSFKFGINKNDFHINRLDYSYPENKTFISVSNLNFKLSDYFTNITGSLYGNMDLNFIKNNSITNLYFNGDIFLSNYYNNLIKDLNGEFTLEKNNLKAKLNGILFGENLILQLNTGNILNDKISIKFESDNLDAEKILGIRSNFNAYSSNNINNQDLSIKKFLINRSVHFDFHSGNIHYKNINFENVFANCEWNNGLLRITDSSAIIFRGKLSIKGIIEKNIFNGEASYTGGRLKDFTELYLKQGKKIYGKIDAKSHFNLNLENPTASTGEISIEAINGEIKDFVIQDKISSLLFNIPLDNLFFNIIRLSGHFQNSTLELKEIYFESKDININAAGNYYLTDKSMKIIADVNFSKEYLSGLPNVMQIFTAGYEDQGRILFHISASDSIDKPKILLMKSIMKPHPE